MQLRKDLAAVAASALMLAACARAPVVGPARSVADRLGSALPDGAPDVDYVVTFQDEASATSHAAAAADAGGTVEAITGQTLHVRGPAGVARVVSVRDDAQVAVNARIHMEARGRADAPVAIESDQNGDAAQAFLTARAVVGVDSLRARFPEADGRGQTVAIFDTGVDFGVEGIKLKGFYDLTKFGKAEADPGVLTGDGALTFAPGLEPRELESHGILDERELRKFYLTDAAADVNGNGKEDQLRFVIGKNADGTRALWIDIDGDGVIRSREKEELTDFNTTHRSIDTLAGAGPSGARALAVTISSSVRVQFHAVLHGHGTSCAIIVAGDQYANGRLSGMAPKAEILAYVLDMTGNDVYTMDEIMRMFVHARDHGADAISASWTFATGDLPSAQYFADFVDTEIAAKGITVAIAAGNAGPGTGSAAAIDYVPKLGFAVGAYISKDQARNVYGWTGTTQDSVIHYSSFGPTRGGRQVPDLVSPLMTLVRGARGADGPSFYAFGGTSSATPALAGAITALKSALMQDGVGRPDARLLKLALQATAHPVPGVDAVRQGAGLVDVNAAYDRYLTLAAELAAATADPLRRAPFAYALTATTSGGAGLHLHDYQSSAAVAVTLDADSVGHIDPLVFVEPLTVTKTAVWMTVPDVLALQSNGARFDIAFDQVLLKKPGVYSDVIELKRGKDGLTLARIPVVIDIPAPVKAGKPIASVSGRFQPFTVWRKPVRLDQAAALTFKGVAVDRGGSGSQLTVVVRNAANDYVAWNGVAITGPTAVLDVTTGVLPAGDYELSVFRQFDQPAVLAPLDVSGAFAQAPAALVAVRRVEGEHGAVTWEAVVEARQAMRVKGAAFTATGEKMSLELPKACCEDRQGYYGQLTLPHAVAGLQIGLRQDAVDRAAEPFAHTSLALVEHGSKLPLYRGWVTVEDEGLPLQGVSLKEKAKVLDVIAYPNIQDWVNVKTLALRLDVVVPLAAPVTGNAEAVDQTLQAGQRVLLRFTTVGAAAAVATGEIALKDESGLVLATVPF